MSNRDLHDGEDNKSEDSFADTDIDDGHSMSISNSIIGDNPLLKSSSGTVFARQEVSYGVDDDDNASMAGDVVFQDIPQTPDHARARISVGPGAEQQQTTPVMEVRQQRTDTVVADHGAALRDKYQIVTTPAPNRCARDFLPAPNSSDPLVVESLKAFAQPTRAILRFQEPYTGVKPPAVRGLDYPIDAARKKEHAERVSEAEADDAAADKHVTGQSHHSQKSTLQNLFVADDAKAPAQEEEKASATAVNVHLEYINNISHSQSRDLATKLQQDLPVDGVMWRYHPEFELGDTAEVRRCKRVPVQMWRRDPGTQLLITVKELKFNFNDLEPFFCTLAVYDLSRKLRLSENFHFDVNKPSVLAGELELALSTADRISFAKHAIFSVTERHEGIYLMLRVERVLQGDPDEVNEIYVKDKQRSVSELQSIAKKCKTNVARLSEYRSPFAWGMAPLFDETGDVMHEGELTMAPLALQKESVMDEAFINQALELVQDPSKKPKVLPGSSFKFSVSHVSTALPRNRVDPSSILLKDTERVLPIPPDQDEKVPVVKEVLEFQDTATISRVPFTSFINLLYVYPETIFFQKFRNIACKVEVRMTDSKLQQEGVKVLLGKSTCGAFASSLNTVVNYHNRHPTPSDEVKVMLPLSLTPKAHLFFTFYQVSCKPQKKGKSVADVIGYSLLPIYPKQRFIQDGIYELPIAEKLPDQYLRPFAMKQEDGDRCHFRNNGEKSFRLRIRLVSSVFNQDTQLNQFFHTFPNQEELTKGGHAYARDLLRGCLESLVDASPQAYVNFLPAILNYLLRLVTTRVEAAYEGFLGLNIVIDKIADFLGESNDRSPLLSSFIQYRFDNVPGGMPVYEAVCRMWIRALAEKDVEEKKEGVLTARTRKIICDTVVRFSWFFFELMFKSMCLEVDRDGTLSRGEEFCQVFEEAIDLFIQVLHQHSTNLLGAKVVNSNLALFFNDLFYVMEKDRVMQMMKQFVDEFKESVKDPVLIQMQVTFLEIVCDHEFYIELQGPVSIAALLGPDDEPTGDVIPLIRNRYPLPTMLVDTVEQHLNYKNREIQKEVQNTVVNTLRAVCTKHEFDQRLQTPEMRQYVATMYFGLIPAVVRCFEAVKEMDGDLRLRRNLLSCFFYVLRNCEPRVLRAWWRTEEPAQLAQFVRLLALAESDFQYFGYEHRKNSDDLDSTLAPESTFSFQETDPSGTAGTVGDFKQSIENLMSNVHKRGKGQVPNSDKASRVRPKLLKPKLATENKSSLRQLRKDGVAAGVLPGPLQSAGGDSSFLSGPGAAGVTSGGTASKSTLRQMRLQIQNQAKQRTLTRMQKNTLTVNSREYLLKLLNWEGALQSIVARTSLLVFLDFLDDVAIDPAENEDICLACLELLVSFLKYPQTRTFHLSLYPSIRVFLKRFGAASFQHKPLHPALTHITREVMRHCTLEQVDLRSQALSILFILLANNFQAYTNLEFLQEALTVAVSDMVPQLTHTSAELLKVILNTLPQYYLQDPAWQAQADPELSRKFKAELDTLLFRLHMILKGQIECMRQEELGDAADATLTEHLLIEIADAFSHVSQIRISWLLRLAKHHIQHNNFAEAGQCYMAVAELELNKPAEQQQEEADASASKQAVIDAYYNACENLYKATLYEQCNEVYKLLLPLYEGDKNYPALATSYKHLHEIFTHLSELQEKGDIRTLGTYYRVGFYGRRFGELLDGKQFVYKMPKITRLAEITTEFRDLFARQLKVAITILPDSRPVDKAQLNPEECVMQVTFVSPYFTEDDEKARHSFIERNCAIDTFTYSTPYTLNNSKDADCTQQYKVVTILKVRHPFPYLKTAQEVITKKETALSPIQSAADDIEVRTRRITELLDSQHIEPKVLSALLAGSVATQVHGGATEVALAFLADHPAPPPPPPGAPTSSTPPPPVRPHVDADEKELLKKSMAKFIVACERGLEHSRSFHDRNEVSDMEKNFHNNLEQQFQSMRSVVEPLIKEKKAKAAKARGVRFG